MLFGCAVLETKSTRKLKNGQSLNQCINFLAAHAVREQIAGEISGTIFSLNAMHDIGGRARRQ